MKMKRTREKRPPDRFPVSVTLGGRTFEGEYTVDGDPPIVSLFSRYGHKETQLGRGNAKSIASGMLHVLVANFEAPLLPRDDI